MKSMVKVLVLGGAAAVLAGCASKGQPLQPQTYNLVSEERTFVFPAENAAGEVVTDAMVMDGLVASMYDASHYGRLSIDNVQQPYESRHWQYMAIEAEGSNLNLAYTNNYYYASMDYNDTTSLDARYQVAIEDQGDVKRVSFTTPSAIHLIPQKSNRTFSADIPPVLSKADVTQDVRQINGMMPAIDQVHQVEGDVDVRWDVSAVKANFDRIFESAPGGDAAYWVPVDAGKQKVSLEVYPYRDGSKVEYEFEVAYELRGDGTSTYPEDAVAQVVANIESAAKD